jgi:hypothetical protein
VLAPGGETELVAQTRRLDNALKDVLTAGKPLEMGPTGRSRRGAKRLLRALQVSNRSAHALARAGVNAARAEPDTSPPTSPPPHCAKPPITCAAPSTRSSR